ncbi:MAG: GNAT family N-acetyltransferase [Alphaproteobacteria bacterium]
MSLSLALYGETPGALFEDVYFRRDFVALHARPDEIDALELPGFRHAAAVRHIPGEDGEDMETPWGYGGPIARDGAAFWEGLGLWRQRQVDRGRVAEFIRLHPFINPLALRGFVDNLRFDRLTVLADLTEPAATRRRRYTKGTRYSIAYAERRLNLRELDPSDAGLFRRLYEEGLARNQAERGYYFAPGYYEELLAQPFTRAWVAERDGEALAVACFLRGGAFAHYHLSGGGEPARISFAHYLLVERALDHYQGQGCRWMHLGGGRTASPDDALLRFKTRFSALRIPFYTGGLVHRRSAYERLTKGRTDRFLSYRFPPTPDLSREQVTLNPAEPGDFAAFFRIKCDIDNIVWSGHDRPPSWPGLESWFQRHEAGGTGRRIFIARCAGRAVGYVYVDDRGTHFEATIGVASGEAGRGLGRGILKEMARVCADGAGRPVEAWIFPENTASVRAFEAAGFVFDEGRPAKPFPMPFAGAEPRKQRCWVWCQAQAAGAARQTGATGQ